MDDPKDDWITPAFEPNVRDGNVYARGATDDKGQMAYYRQEGYFKETPEPYADLGEIAAGRLPGREHAEERTVCVNLGLALEDMATAIRIYEKAVERGIGARLPL